MAPTPASQALALNPRVTAAFPAGLTRKNWKMRMLSWNPGRTAKSSMTGISLKGRWMGSEERVEDKVMQVSWCFHLLVMFPSIMANFLGSMEMFEVDGGFNGHIIYKSRISHCHVWLAQGSMDHFRGFLKIWQILQIPKSPWLFQNWLSWSNVIYRWYR